MLYIIYGLIILITIILYFIVKDKKEFFKKIGITTISSGVILLVIGLVINILLNTFLNSYNISKISSLLLQKFIHGSIHLLTLGGIELLCIILINKKKIIVPTSNNNISNQKFDNY